MENNHTSLPSLPGIYLFKNKDEILYIGKAKLLKKRIAHYFQRKDYDWKVQALIQEHTHIEHIVTHSETDALLLEAQLVKEHQPKFNVLLKNGQPFVYIVFTKEEIPTIELVRNKKKKGTYFGPFLHKRQARSAYNYLMTTFKLRFCNKKIANGCLDYHIGNCAGSCLDQFNTADYIFRIDLAKSCLAGHYKQTLKILEEQIKHYCNEKLFEKAQHLHEYIQHLDIIFETLKTKFSESKYAPEIVATTKVHTRENKQLAYDIQKLLQLDKPAITIDCFDISHFQSSFIVGSCIRFIDGVPDKNNFRRFKIKTLQQQDDYAALQEIVSRRYKVGNLPDLIIIDGGKGQLHAVQKIVPPEQACISLAKREERIFSNNFPNGQLLDIKTDCGKMIIALRDYAHHFAITYHRKRRSMNE